MAWAAKVFSVGCMISLSAPLMVQAEDARGLSAVPYDPYWVRGGDLCAAADKRQISLGDASGTAVLSARPAVWLCDCGSSSADECSESTLKQEVIGFALCPTIEYSSTTCTDLNVNAGNSEASRTRYVGASESVATSGGNTSTYATAATGVSVGTASAGGFVGTASHLLKTGKFNYNKNEFLTRDVNGVELVAKICVVPGDATSTSFSSCGTEKELLPGGYEFSVFGQAWGADYSTLAAGFTNQGMQTNDATNASAETTTTDPMATNASTETTTTESPQMGGTSYLNFRTVLCGTGMSDLKVNGVASGTGILGTDTQVTSVSFTQTDNSSLTFSFEQDYMFGDVSGISCVENATAHKFGPTKQCSYTPAGKKSVKVTASASSTCQGIGKKGLYLDYGFELFDLSTAGKWFVYNSEISTSNGDTAKDGGLPDGTTTGSALVSEAGHSRAASLVLLTILYSIATRT